MLHNDVNLGDVSYNIQLHQKTINTKNKNSFPAYKLRSYSSNISISYPVPQLPLDNIPNVESTPNFFSSPRTTPFKSFLHMAKIQNINPCSSTQDTRSSYMYILSIFQNCHNLTSTTPLTYAKILFLCFCFYYRMRFWQYKRVYIYKYGHN